MIAYRNRLSRLLPGKRLMSCSSYRNLVAQGVIRDNTRLARPNPFPNQFVPDPR